MSYCPLNNNLITDGTETLVNGMILCLPFNDSSATNLTNLVDGNQSNTISGWTWGTDATEGAYLSSDGTTSTLLKFLRGGTLTAFPTGDMSIFVVGKAGGTSAAFFGLGSDTIDGSGGWGIQMGTGATSFVTSSPIAGFSTGAANQTGALHKLFVRSGTTYKDYSNGSTIATLTQSGTGVRNSTGSWYIGAVNPGSSTKPDNVWISLLYAWNRALTSTEITNLFANPLAPLGSTYSGSPGSSHASAYGYGG